MTEECANPLLLKWIKEWYDQARERNSKGVTTYKKAYESMKACPLKFNHPSEAQQLNGLGPKLCERLTQKLKEHCERNGLPMPEDPHKVQKRRSEEDLPAREPPAKKQKKAKPYVPTLRSGPYALLIALAKESGNSSHGMTKSALIEAAQPYCDSSFTVPSDPSKFHTAWNSMKTLIQKDLVYEQGRPLKRYFLTDEGWEVARRVMETALDVPSQSGSSRDPPRNRRDDDDDFELEEIPPPQTISGSIAAPGDPIVLPPGSFTIELILDCREIRTQKDRDYIANELSKKGITAHVRSLELGDATWVAKCKDRRFLSNYGESGDEVMLDWIIERKRLDDLVGSIKDGRFHEQKFRLRRSGIPNVIYLIEEFAIAHDAMGPSGTRIQEAVASAIASTQVVNGYFVKRTKNLDDTIRYLARMTFLLRSKYSDRRQRVALVPSTRLTSHESYLSTLADLRSSPAAHNTTFGVTSATFATLSSKSDTLTLRDVFLKMLMCTRGISGEKALEIQRRWPTPRAFIEAFEAADRETIGASEEDRKKAKERVVAGKMGNLIARKKVSGALSRRLAEIWGETGYQ
ncbi:hypothetical protein VTN49DRAFT_5913 [Thermomyces lanuginosus]|uniref:uncharacterized protein n=1 Tax=Thermomyces lanuginosus TaxID=5541 RepID=UPI003743A552